MYDQRSGAEWTHLWSIDRGTLPTALIAVAVGIIVAFLLNQSGAGVKLVGEIPVGLGLLVVIRTFLSWSLVFEMEGRRPWKPKLVED